MTEGAMQDNPTSYGVPDEIPESANPAIEGGVIDGEMIEPISAQEAIPLTIPLTIPLAMEASAPITADANNLHVIADAEITIIEPIALPPEL